MYIENASRMQAEWCRQRNKHQTEWSAGKSRNQRTRGAGAPVQKRNPETIVCYGQGTSICYVHQEIHETKKKEEEKEKAAI